MLQMKIKTGRRSVVPGDLPSILGAQRAYRELGDLVEALIAQMDMLAGDCDLEPEHDFCVAGDDGCGPVYINGIEHWGSPDDWAPPITPAYGMDQTAGIINAGEIEAEMARRADAAARRDYEILLSLHGRRAA